MCGLGLKLLVEGVAPGGDGSAGGGGVNGGIKGLEGNDEGLSNPPPGGGAIGVAITLRGM